MDETLIDERLIVDVSHVDWSNHPGWSRDFECCELTCDPPPPEWAGDVIARVKRYRCEDGSVERRRERVSGE